MRLMILTPLMSFLIASTILAQVPSGWPGDSEPTLARAADRLVERVADRLLDAQPAPEALWVVSDGGVEESARRAVAEVLKSAGFTLVAAGGPGVQVVKVSVLPQQSGRFSLALTLPGLQSEAMVCGFGDTDLWDSPPGEGLVVTGPFRSDPQKAVAAGLDAAGEALSRRMKASRPWTGREVDHLPRQLFVATRVTAAGPLYRAYVRLDPDDRQLRALERSVAKRERRKTLAPWLRGAGTLGLAVVALLGFLKLDLVTRGYATGRLILIFGSLFCVGAGLCWKLPL